MWPFNKKEETSLIEQYRHALYEIHKHARRIILSCKTGNEYKGRMVLSETDKQRLKKWVSNIFYQVDDYYFRKLDNEGSFTDRYNFWHFNTGTGLENSLINLIDNINENNEEEKELLLG